MPRKPRFNLIGIPQHVIQRGNNRDPKLRVRVKTLYSFTDIV